MTDESNRGPITIQIDADLEPLVPGFLENRRNEVSDFRTALGAADLETLESLGHSLKGTGGGYGFDTLTDIGREIEQRAQSADIEGIRTHVDRLADFLERVQVRYV